MTQFSDMVARLARLNARADEALAKARPESAAAPKSGGQTLRLKSAPVEKRSDARKAPIVPGESTMRLIERTVAKHNQVAGASWQRANLHQALTVWRRGANGQGATEVVKSSRGLARLDAFLNALSTGCQAVDADLLPPGHPHAAGAR
jgi:hypothetical protein